MRQWFRADFFFACSRTLSNSVGCQYFIVPRFLYLMSHTCYIVSSVILQLHRCEYCRVLYFVFTVIYRLAFETRCDTFGGMYLTHKRDCKNIAAWQRRKLTTVPSGFEWMRTSSSRSNVSRQSLICL